MARKSEPRKATEGKGIEIRIVNGKKIRKPFGGYKRTPMTADQLVAWMDLVDNIRENKAEADLAKAA